MKQQITRKFNKSSFEILNCDTASDGDWSGIDEYIRPFIKKLNNSEHISTFFSCEGHKEDDTAYLFFNVDEYGWDMFWQEILPKLSYEFCQPINIPDNPNVIPFYQLMWHFNLTDNEHNTGISIHCPLSSFYHENDNCKILVSWEEKKKRFWDIMQSTFMEHFMQDIIFGEKIISLKPDDPIVNDLKKIINEIKTSK